MDAYGTSGKFDQIGIPSASEALEAASRPRQARAHPHASQKALRVAMNAIQRAVGLGMTSTVAEAPTFVFGEPRFNIDDITGHVKSVLERHGYQVTIHQGSPLVAISWGGLQSEGDSDSKSMGQCSDAARTIRISGPAPPSQNTHRHTDADKYNIGL